MQSYYTRYRPTRSRGSVCCLARLGMILPILLCLSGCGSSGPPRGSVQGKVTLDGQPVEQGTITFLPTGGTTGPSAGGVITGGQYSIEEDKGPVAGKSRVEIRWERKTGKKVPAGSPSPPGTMIDQVAEAIPAKYNSKSTLEKEIKEGDNTLDFELTSK